MSEHSSSRAAVLSGTAFATLLLIALMMGANHVAARMAFDNGVDVATAVSFRSSVTAVVVGLLLVLQRVPVRLTARHKRGLLAIGVLVGLQSLCLYSSVARLPVALALLAFNTYPLWTALWARLAYRHRPERRVLVAMPVMLLGLALALDVLGAASGLGAAAQWRHIGAGVAFALGAAAMFGLALVLTQHEAGDLDGRLRTATTMGLVAVIALAGVSDAGRLSSSAGEPRLVGTAAPDVPLRHGVHHHVHGAAAPRGRRQLGHHERRADLRAACWPGPSSVSRSPPRRSPAACSWWPRWCGSACAGAEGAGVRANRPWRDRPRPPDSFHSGSPKATMLSPCLKPNSALPPAATATYCRPSTA